MSQSGISFDNDIFIRFIQTEVIFLRGIDNKVIIENMALPVVEFSRQGYIIGKVFA